MRPSRYTYIIKRFLAASGLAMMLLCTDAITTEMYAAKPKTSNSKGKTKKNTQKQKQTTLRKSGDVKKEKQQTQKEIADTQKRITDNEKRTRSQLNQLNNLDSQIERQEITIDELAGTLEGLSARVEALSDSIILLQRNDSILCRSIAEGLRQRHVQNSRITPLAFVTSSASVSEARQRINYLNVLERAQNKKVAELREERERMRTVSARLDSVKANQSAVLKQLATARNILANRRQESQKVVNNLRKETASLNKVLQDKQKKIKQLNAELDRIIAEEQRRAEEQRKAEERRRAEEKRRAEEAAKKKTSVPAAKGEGLKKDETKQEQPPSHTQPKATAKESATATAEANRNLTGSFASNKGRLLFPVAGKYSIVGTFGRSQHGELNHVQMDNSGIDISVARGTTARSVFGGTVSSIFFMDGYENIVIVRHGDYLTVYAGLSSINVRKGENVKAGQTLGTVATLDDNTTLHFEVRHEKAKLNPLQWVK